MKRLECVAVQQDAYRLNVDELPTCLSVNVNDPELHRKLWAWSLNALVACTNRKKDLSTCCAGRASQGQPSLLSPNPAPSA